MTPPQKPAKIGADGFELVTEPIEAAFTMLMPAGWTNQTHLQREHSLNRMLATAVSPDRNTMIQFGDPRLPLFMVPNPNVDPATLAFSPHIVLQPYTSAEYFLPDYAQRFFGSAPGFRMIRCQPSPRLGQLLSTDLAQSGHHAQVTSAAVEFEHRGNGPLMHCELQGATIMGGMMWMAELYCVSTTDDLGPYREMAWRMWTSRQSNAAVVAQQQRLHQQRMAAGAQQLQHINQMTELQRQGHAQRMHDIQAFGSANTRMHEERMAQHDASHQSWMDRQAQTDVQQQSWMSQQVADDAQQQARVNAIREEHTAVDASGASYQVDIHHERYYVNKRDNTYIGAGATIERHDLRRNFGVNPDDFEEVKIVR